MNANEIYLNLVSNKLAVSEALALTIASVPLTPKELEWIKIELNGYDNKLHIPDYRTITCDVKARVQYYSNSSVQDEKMVGPAMDQLESLLNERLGISIYKMYVFQGVESIEQQVRGKLSGDIIMRFETGQAQDLKDSLKLQASLYNFKILDVFQSTSVAYLNNTLCVIKNRLMSILQKYLVITTTQNIPTGGFNVKKKIVFISYCWENEEHKLWVKKLADDLREEFTIRIDQELPFGVELTKFMEDAISLSDKVLIIVTPEYKNRADNRIRGVGYETSLITDDLVTDQNRIKFIPIIRKGTKETSYPKYLGSKMGADMTDDNQYENVLSEIIRNLRDY